MEQQLEGVQDNLDVLEIKRIIGFNGQVPGGLKVHPDNNHIMYPLGHNIIIENISSSEQTILSKHTNNVTCIAIDPTGKLVASGQANYMGFKAAIVTWDYETKKPISEWELHKVKVEALAFSSDGCYLISLGGRDCGVVVVWDLRLGEALCGNPAQVDSAGVTTCLAASLKCRDIFVTAGTNTLRVWNMDPPNRKVKPTEVKCGGGVKRTVVCVELADHKSEFPFMFCGTESGDVLVVNIISSQLQCIFPSKDKFSLGVTALSLINYHDEAFDFILGSGTGLVGRYEFRMTFDKYNKIISHWKHHAGVQPWMHNEPRKRSAITSIAKRGAGHMFFAGSSNSQIYKFNYAELKPSLIKTCHSTEVNDVAFAHGDSELIITCAKEEIRIWSTKSGLELQRYIVTNMICSSICVTRDGHFIFSAWDDGCIRVIGFWMEKGGLINLFEKFCIRDCHNKGVTAIGVTSKGDRLVSGGGEGQVRVWKVFVEPGTKKDSGRGEMVANMKEHKGKVTAIQVHPNDKLCVSASTDGSTIIWDLETNTRSQIVLANTLFKCVCFGAGGDHILTSGTDHKIGYWEVLDGGILRELQGATTGAINAIDIACDGKTFITGGEDHLLKLWLYNEGSVHSIGIGHSSVITNVRICPNQRLIVSVGSDGAIHIWKFPTDMILEAQHMSQ